MIDPWLGMALVLSVLGGLLAGLRLLQQRVGLHPEVLRKILHVGMGSVTLGLPWLFAEGWPVLGLTVVSILLLGSLRLVKSLRCGLGSVVNSIGRTSLGEIYFPIGVCLLFHFYQYVESDDSVRHLLLYLIPVLLLTLADAAAALIGIAYGRMLYLTSEGPKSAEGSLAFFLCSFFCVYVPLLYTELGHAEVLLIALLMAMLAMLFEAVAWNGLDNLLLPLVSYFLLRLYYDLSVQDLWLRLAVTGVVILILLVFTRRSTLVGNAVLGAFLVGYISCTLGGWQWLLPPVLVLATYPWFAPHTDRNRRRIHHIHSVVCVSSAGLIWLLLNKIFDQPDFLLPYTVSFAAHLAMIGIARLKNWHPEWSCRCVLRKTVLASWVILFLPYLAVQGWTAGGITTWQAEKVLIGLAGTLVAALVFYATQPCLQDCPLDSGRWLRQALDAGLGSVVGLVPLYVF